MSANEIPPGGEGKITVTVRTGSRRAPFRQIVTVNSNDPNQANARLTVLADVLVDVEHKPAIMRFVGKESSPATITLHNYGATPVELSNLESTSEYVNVSLASTTIPPNDEVILTGELSPDVPVGVLSGWIKLETNLKAVPILQIRVWGNIQ